MEARERYLEGQAIQEAREEGRLVGIREVIEWVESHQGGTKEQSQTRAERIFRILKGLLENH